MKIVLDYKRNYKFIKSCFMGKLGNYYIRRCFLLLCMLGIIMISCNSNQNKDKEAFIKSIVEDNLGKKLIIPNNLIAYKPFSDYIADSLEISNSEYKIYSHINASCGTCINNIQLWNSKITEFNKYNTSIILIFESDDDFEYFKFVCESNGITEFPFPFFLDVNNEFVKLNKFMETINDFETVLTDKYNKILAMGNPIINRNINDLYFKMISSK